MAITPNNDIEAIDIILSEILCEGIPQWFDESAITNLFDNSYYHEASRIFRKMQKLELIEKSDKGFGGIPVWNPYSITDHAREILHQHSSYAKYLEYQDTLKKKESKTVFLDRFIKNGNVIAALLLNVVTIVLSRCSKEDNTKQQKIEEGIQLVSKELDSLKQVLRNIPIPPMPKPKEDTATKK